LTFPDDSLSEPTQTEQFTQPKKGQSPWAVNKQDTSTLSLLAIQKEEEERESALNLDRELKTEKTKAKITS